MKIKAIQSMIESAKAHEMQYGHLATLLSYQIKSNQKLPIQLPEHGPLERLLTFVTSYIEHVPEFIEATRSITSAAGIADYAEPFVALAEDYFLKPPSIVAGHFGLHELMYEAYLAHRLIEEVNDRIMLHTSVPLVPMDMTKSNLLIHSLIGEPFANELDDAVHYTAQIAVEQEHVYSGAAFQRYVEAHRNNRWSAEVKHWPCLIDHLASAAEFSGRVA
ncbi:MAG: hypothetical protein ACI9WS_001351 [Paraglaciecola psychrophila]